MFDMGALVGGFQGGMGGGYDLMAKRRELMEQARTQQAQRAIGQGQINAAPPLAGPPQGMPPQAPPGGGGGAPQTVPMPGASFMPQRPPAPPQPMDPGMSAPRPQGGPGPMPAPQSAMPPQAPPQAAPAPAPAFSGAAQPSGQGGWADSGQTVDRLFQQLIQQNPDLRKDPMTLFAAAQQQIGLMKGVGSDVKDMMQAQLKMRQMDIQQQHYDSMSQNYLRQHQDRLTQIDARLKMTNLNNEERTHLQQMRNAELTNLEQMRDATSRYRTDVMADTSNYRTDTQANTAGARIEELATHDDNMEEIGLDKAELGSMGRPDDSKAAAPKLRSRTPTQLPRGGQGGGRTRSAGGAPQGYPNARKAPDGKWYVPNNDPKTKATHPYMQVG